MVTFATLVSPTYVPDGLVEVGMQQFLEKMRVSQKRTR